ncbi:MAG: DUF4965 domain-containing protein [Ruminococcaceae bacterium]|nr:DUF4965 domain-containing protein [Oscillospiraceae bacterium]
MKMRAPAVPLITVDPYFSVWSPDTTLNVARTEHWTGKSNSIIGSVVVDGVEYSFLGYYRDLYKMRQDSLEIDALSTKAVFETDKIRLTATFTTPVLPDDYRLLTRPVSYMNLSYESIDGVEHTVIAKAVACEELCLNKAGESPVMTEEVAPCCCVKGMRMGNTVQNPLNRSGDDLRIDWGYFYLAAKGEGVETASEVFKNQTRITVTAPLTAGESRLFLFAYDDIVSIEYFGKHLKSYWNKDGQTIEAAICEAAKEYDEVLARCDAFAARLYADTEAAGGEKYAEILSLAYRQVIAGHKLVLDEQGEILWISKECFSNGCAATVDVSYPSIPMFLIYNPELVKGMMRPVYRYADSDEWKVQMKYDFAPHDVGCYPLLNGQVYGKKRNIAERKYENEGVLDYNKQMPVEECGNMLIMEAGVALATGSADFAAAHIDVLRGWCEYLLRYGTDPENQLCTDDFAGHLAHNCNLSLKAIMGIESMAILEELLGNEKAAASYRRKARKMAKIWKETALNADGTSNLAFDRPGTYSMKYNMVWDKVFGSRIFGKKFMDAEVADNRKHFNAYGMPLDSRTDYTKSDWLVWTASMATSKKSFMSYIAPLWRAYDEMPTRVPLTDWYDTVSSRMVSFRHRTVQGGLWMRVLMEKWAKK